MEVKFQRWGNSVAVRIPAPALRAMGIKDGDPADLTVAGGTLVLTPSHRRRRVPLEDYVARITDENRHDEVSWGAPVGREAW